MFRRFLVLAEGFALAAFASSAFAFLPPHAREDGAVDLPGQGQEIEVPASAGPGAKASPWSRFQQSNPRWAATWNGYTGTPHRAYGQGIEVTGPVTHADQASEAALRFLREAVPFTRAAEVDLDVVGALRGGRVWYVHFRQNHDGVQVLGDDISVRLGEDGKVFAFAADIRSDLEVDVRPRFSAEEARGFAREGLDFDVNADRVRGGDQLWILPLDADGATRFALVRQVSVTQQDPPHEWVVMVDAHTGEVVWRYDRVRYGSVAGAVTADVHERVPSDPFTEVPLRNVYVKVDGVDVTTDELGAYVATGLADGEVTLELRLQGPWGTTTRQDGGVEAFFSTTVDASVAPTFDHQWDNTNSHPSERDGFRNAERTHQWIKTLDPGFAAIDYQMPVAVLVDGSCNAFWNGTGINFFKGGNGCRNTAMLADVVAHEYGHGINDKLYQQAGSPNGMTSGALHEGMADVTAAFLFDDPVIGDEFFVDGSTTALRNVDNTNALPHDLIGRVHTDGQIIAGAFWDLREAIGLEEAARLAHFAKYGLPDSATNQRMAFREYLLETLIVDDDDSDLSNGTPHWNEIIASFAQHGIDRSLYVVLDHVGADDPADASAVTVRASVYSQEPAAFPLDNASVKLFYSVDGESHQEVPMVLDGAPIFAAEIPAQELGSVVRYYFEAQVVGGEVKRVPANPTSQQFDYVVGVPQTVFADDFESDLGWTVGADDDTAVTGIWERAVPQLTDNGSQPGADHTRTGLRCYVTGNDHQDPQNPQSFAPGLDDVDDGRTTLVSPVLDLSGSGVKVVRYWRLFNNNLGRVPGQPLPDDPWVVEISNDGGLTWTTVENDFDSNIPSGRASLTSPRDWQRVTFRVDEFVTPTDQVRLRFIASDVATPSLVEALLDDFEALSIPNESVPVLVSNFWLRQDDTAVTLQWHAPVQTANVPFRLEAARGSDRWTVDVAQPEPGRFLAVDRRGVIASGSLTYSLFAREQDRWTLVHEETILVSSAPVRIALHAPAPNPFNPRATVAFSIDRGQRVKLAVYDLAGRQVKVLADGEFTPGTHAVSWEGLDEAGRRVGSGVYFLKMAAERFTGSRKLVLLQ